MKSPSPAFAARLALLVTLTVGCEGNREAAPSAEYERAHARWSALLERHRDFDAAALDPDFAEVIALLDAVPGDRLAQDFRSRLNAIHDQAERTRRERLARRESLRYRPVAPSAIATAAPEPSPDASVPTGGSADDQVPTQGMSTALFKERFGDCFAFASALEVEGLGQGEIWRLAARDACRERLPDFADKSILLVGDTIESVRPTASLTAVERILFEGREISREERDCLEENYRRALAGQAPLDCQERRLDPYQAPAQTPATTSIISL